MFLGRSASLQRSATRRPRFPLDRRCPRSANVVNSLEALLWLVYRASRIGKPGYECFGRLLAAWHTHGIRVHDHATRSGGAVLGVSVELELSWPKIAHGRLD